MIINIFNIILLIGFLISTLYGVITVIKNNKIHLIFKVTLISMIALLISRLFFLVLNISNGDSNEFSVGILGQVSAYLFFALANKTYLPFISKKSELSVKAILILLIPIACYFYSFIIVKTVGDLVSSILYLFSTCFAMYFSFKNLLLTRTNKDYNNLKGFFICVIIMTMANSLENVIILINNPILFNFICSLVTIINFVNIILILPILNKEVRKC